MHLVCWSEVDATKQDFWIAYAATDGPGIKSRWGARFSALAQTGPEAYPVPPIQWALGLFRGVKWPGRDEHPPSHSAEVKERPSWPVIGWPLPFTQPLPQFNNSTDFTVQWPAALRNFIIVIFYNFSKHNIKAPWRWCRGTKTCRSVCNIIYYIHVCIYTGLFEMTVGVSTTCHKQYTWDSSICILYLIEQHSKFWYSTYLIGALCVHPLWFYKHQHDNLKCIVYDKLLKNPDNYFE